MAQTKPKAGQFYGVSNNGTDGEFLQTDGTGGMAWASPITNPTITSIDYPGSATAADPAGGESVIINGTLFASGITCTVGGTSAVTAFNSATQITITTPAKAAGPYTVAVLNPDGGTASQASFIQYSGVPVWSTAAGTLGNVQEGEAASFQVTATEGSDTIEYAVTTGTLPTGLSLATATGAITGTAPAVSADTTTTFSITATDDENQTSASRSFSITVQNDAPSNHFNTIIWDGDGSSNRLIPGLNFQSDFVWAKQRTPNATDNIIVDSVRGGTGTGPTATNLNLLYTAGNYAQATNVGNSFIPSIENNGFKVGTHSYVNSTGSKYVAWCLKAGGAAVANTEGTTNSQVSVNNTLGFSIVDYTAVGGTSVGHGLDGTPDLIILKGVDAAEAWQVYNSTSGTGKYILLNDSQAEVSRGNSFSSVTATTFTNNWTGGNINWVAYCFKSKPGFSKSSTYTGTGVSGTLISTGFEPAFIIIKKTNGTGNWLIWDNKRNSSNPRNTTLVADTNRVDYTTNLLAINFLSNGFQITGTDSDYNGSGNTYLYLAFAADGSTATPSLANSFATKLYTGNGGTQSVTTGFAPDLTWTKVRSNADSNFLWNTISGANQMLMSNSTSAELTRTGVTAFNSNGFTLGNYAGVNTASYTYVSWNWKAGGTPSINTDGTITSLVSANQAAGFSVVSYSGNSTSGATVGHGLDAAPELILFKALNSSASWIVYSTPELGDNKYLTLNDSHAGVTATNWLNTNSTNFTLNQTFSNCNTSGINYIAYNFTSISGYSKVGTYTGTGVAGEAGSLVNVGFLPQFVFVKRTDAANQWVVSSTLLGYNDLYWNLSDAQFASGTLYGAHYTSSGFFFNTADGSRNASGATYIYMAIA